MPIEISSGCLVSDRYRIHDLIGEGGMGAVYRCTDLVLDETVALKFLGGRSPTDPRIVARFIAEVKAVRRIQHRSVVHGYDIGQWGPHRYLVMQYIDGKSLSAVLAERGRLPLAEVLPLITQVIAGVKAAHDEGIVHRDLKADNILVDRQGRAYILDFGISHSKDDAHVTLAGDVLGSPLYIAPEQAQGREVDHRADIYSLGVILFELLTGGLPYSGNDPLAVALKHVTNPPVSPRSRDPSIPVQVDRVILRCLQKQPADRYEEVTLLLRDLMAEPIQGQPSPSAANRAHLESPPPAPRAPLPLPIPGRCQSVRIAGGSFYHSHRAWPVAETAEGAS